MRTETRARQTAWPPAVRNPLEIYLTSFRGQQLTAISSIDRSAIAIRGFAQPRICRGPLSLDPQDQGDTILFQFGSFIGRLGLVFFNLRSSLRKIGHSI